MMMEISEEDSILADRISMAIRRFMSSNCKKCAIMFSGGVDSLLIAALSSPETPLYTIGVEGSHDLESSESSAKHIGRKVNAIKVTAEDIVGYARELVSSFPDIKVGELGYEAVLLAGCVNIEEMAIVTGQGADELFLGYRRLREHPDLSGFYMERLNARTAPREREICRKYGKELLNPYLCHEILSVSSEVRRLADPGQQYTNKKLIRIALSRLGLPDFIVEKNKKAAQYGSGFDKIIRRNIARIMGR